MAGIMSIAALGLYSIKITGQLAAGHAAFMGLGGYAAGVVTARLGVSLGIGLVVSATLVRLGQAFRAVWEDDQVASSVGIDVTRIRLLSFVMGCTAAGLAGVLYAHFLGIMEPKDLDFVHSVTLLIFVAFGGLETHWGALFG